MKRLILLLIVIASSALATPTPTPTATATASSTNTPTPTPTATRGGSNEPINIDTKNHKVKVPIPAPTPLPWDINYVDTNTVGLLHLITLYVDGSGSVLTTGTKNPVKIPIGGTLRGWTMTCKPSGSVTVDIYRSANGAGLPTVSIVGAGTKPAIASNVENLSNDLSSWTSTMITPADNLAVNLSGISTATYVEITLAFK
jgi:hypothetical protein